MTAPRTGWLQIAVIVAAWAHGCLGLFFLLRLCRWFAAWQSVLLTAAVLLPVLFRMAGEAAAWPSANVAVRGLRDELAVRVIA